MERLPAEYGPSTVHDWFQRWAEGGVLEKIWAVLVEACEELGGVEWEWQAADGMLGKARFGGEKGGQEPHRSRKKGTKKSLLVDGDGGPLGIVIDGANVLEQAPGGDDRGLVVERPDR